MKCFSPSCGGTLPSGRPDPDEKPSTEKTWHCGTLTYTKMGLVSLFGFMIWGDFANTIMNVVIPSIMPLKFKGLGASNLTIGLFMTTIPSILQVFMNPYISFKSDRCRSRWGRRIPFILFTIPPCCITLVALAFGEDISRALMPHIQQWGAWSPTTVTVGILGLLLVVYLFFDQFVNAIFCGLFNDVVPTPLMGRFMGTMQIVGSFAGFLYNYFVFQYAETHMREIFLGATVLYFFGVGMMCLFVKETKHPPVSESEKRDSRGLAAVKSYFKESFCHKFYWTKFSYKSIGYMSGAGTGVFMVFFYKEMGLTLGDVGRATAIISVGNMATAYFASIFIDRWHPLRIVAYSGVMSVVFIVSNFVWIFITISPSAFFWLHLLGAGLIGSFSNSVTMVSSLPFDMRLHPKSRFTQFCSAQTLLRSGCSMFAGVLGGLYFDSVKWVFPGSDFAYRFWFLWPVFWTSISSVLVYSLYRQWQALGGDRHFQVPAPWSPTGFEQQDQSRYIGPQTKWLQIDMRIIQAVMLLSILYLVPLCYWLWKKEWSHDLYWHIAAIIPGSIAIYVWWLFVARSLKADIARCKAGETPSNGIPHHGILFIKSCALLLLLGIWFGKTIVAVNEGLKGGLMVLGCANLLTNALFIVTFLVLRKMERGHDPMLDCNDYAHPPASQPT